jgi:GH24 family phage-related lysozyme (muramidase)
MGSTTVQRMREHIKKNEGVVDRPYRDSKGLLTAGSGFKVDTEDAFAALPFQVKDAKTGQWRDAKDDEKRDEFQRIQSMSEKELKKDKNAFRIPEDRINTKVESEIAERIDKIKNEVGAENWDRLSDGQKTAILDVHYANGSLEKYPNLKQAIKDGDAEGIGKNVDFHSGGARNWDRLVRNRAEAQGISEDEARRQVEEDKQNGVFGLEHLRPQPRPEPEGEGQNGNQAPTPPTTPGNGEPPQPAPEPPLVSAMPPHPQPEAQQQTGSEKEQNASEPPADPKVASMVEMAGTPIDNPGQSALLKPVEKLTQSEMTDMIHSAQEDYRGWRSGDPLKAHTYEKVQDWHVNVYGDQPQGNDGGKPIEPTPIRPIPEQPSPHTTPQGEDLWQATARIGQQMADAAGSDGTAEAVKGLQRGLNMLNEANPLPKRSPAYGPYTKLGPVDEDGQYGPQTDFALKHATARLGPNKVDEAFALGRFNTFARNAQRNGNPEGLEDRSHSIFGPLFRDPADGAAPKVEGGILQETLNGFGQDLKVDNWVGPKTTEAFNTVLRENDADELTRAFGRGLGLL